MRRGKFRRVGAFALLLSICAPGLARATEESVWDVIDLRTRAFEQLVLSTGYTNVLSRCGNGESLSTAFIPLDEFIESYLRSNDLEMIDLLGNQGMLDQLIADHVVNGFLDPVRLADPNLTSLETWSGRKLVRELSIGSTPEVGVNILINGQFVMHYAQACNGMVYFLYGDTYSNPSAKARRGVDTQPANFAGSPHGAQTPGRPGFYETIAVGSDLPDTL